MWSYHEVSHRLEIMARRYTPGISADAIDFKGGFVATMVSTLKMRNLDEMAIRTFSAKCSAYKDEYLREIPQAEAQSLFGEFVRLFDSVS